MKTVLPYTSQQIYTNIQRSPPWNLMPFPRRATVLSVLLSRLRNRTLLSLLPTEQYAGGVHFPDVLVEK
jgi:hypothetical protein